MSDFLIRAMPFLMAIPLTAMAFNVGASTHPANARAADNAIHLAGEADVVIALVAQMEEAIRLSSTMAVTSRSKSMREFSRKEINKRTGQIAQLRKWCRRWFDDSCNKPGDTGWTAGKAPNSDLAFASAMSANHARLLEVIEFGLGLKPRKSFRELMERIQNEGYDELAFLRQTGVPAEPNQISPGGKR